MASQVTDIQLQLKDIIQIVAPSASKVEPTEDLSLKMVPLVKFGT